MVPQLFGLGGRTRLDWFTRNKATKFLSQIVRGGVALARRFAQAFEANGLQIARNAEIEKTRRNGLDFMHLPQNLFQRIAHKGRAACENEIE